MNQDLPPYGRLIAAGLTVACVVGLLLNHFLPDGQSVGRLMLLALAPMGLFLGLGGMVEPKILWSVGKYGGHLPVMYKVISGVLALAGVIVTLLLVFLVYPLGPG